MKKFWIFLQGFSNYAFFTLPEKERYYPYAFPEEMLTQNWEAVGRDLRQAVKAYRGGQSNE